MNKAEFKRRLEEVDSLIARGKYAEAVSKCDLLNLDLIDQPRKLQNIAKAYEKCRRYADAEDLLLLAREQAPRSRSIVFHLCSVATKADEIDEARKYYHEFCELAKNDTQQYVLQYRLARAEKQPDSVLIEILENYKMAEPDDRWMIELAKLYAAGGDTEKAVGVCEDIALWFNTGKFVKEARALKAKLLGEAEEPEEDENPEESKVTERPAAPEMDDDELMNLPSESVQEIAAEAEEKKRNPVSGASNYYGAPRAEAQEVTPETLKALAKTVSHYSVPSHETPVTEVSYSEEEAPVSETAYVEIRPEKKRASGAAGAEIWPAKKQAVEATDAEIWSEKEQASEATDAEIRSEKKQASETTDAEIRSEKKQASETAAMKTRPEKEKKTFAVPEFVAPVFDDDEPKEIEDMAFTMEAGTDFGDTAGNKALSEECEASEKTEAAKNRTSGAEEAYVYDGLRQVEIELSEDDDMMEVIWQDPEVFAAEAAMKKQAEESVNPASWGKIDFTDDEEEEENASVSAYSLPGANPYKAEETRDTEKQTAFSETAGEVLPEQAAFSETAGEVLPEQTAFLKATEAVLPEQAEDGFELPAFEMPDFSGNNVFLETEAEDEHIVMNVTDGAEGFVSKTPEEEFFLSPEEEPEILEEPDEDDDFNSFLLEIERRDSERSLFGNLPIEPEVTSATWHFVVFGETNMLTTECAREKMKEISNENTTVPEKMLKITSEKIGGASIINSLDRFLGNMVIVEQAASLSDSQLAEFAKVLDKDDRSLLIAFTDSKDDLIEMFRRVPALAESFTAVFEGKKFNARDLVNTAKEYLLSQDARMTKAAEGLVYERARKLLSEKQGFYKNDIREYAELALQKADRGGFLGLGQGKCDDEGLLIVDEKHFRKAEKA